MSDYGDDAQPDPGEPAGHGMSGARLEAFSDGVFAIVITLLVLDLPAADGLKHGHYASDLGRNWQTYVAYLGSFFVVGTLWINHHATFRLLRRSTYRLQLHNLLLLLPISILPWPTEILADAAKGGSLGDQRFAVLIFGGTMIAMTAAFNSLWRYVRHHPDLLHPWVTPELLAVRTRRYNLGLPFYPAVTLIGLFNIEAFLFLNVALAVLYLLPTPDMDA